MALDHATVVGVRVVPLVEAAEPTPAEYFEHKAHAADEGVEAARLGRKPGFRSVKRDFCNKALAILNDERARPQRGRGRLTELVRMIHQALGQDYKPNTIEKTIRETVREWENRNPATLIPDGVREISGLQPQYFRAHPSAPSSLTDGAQVSIEHAPQRQARAQATLGRQEPPGSSTIPEWCRRHRLSRAMYYKLKRLGKGPKVMMLGKAPRITDQADLDWQAERERESAEQSA